MKRKLDRGAAKTEFSDRLEAAAMAAVSAEARPPLQGRSYVPLSWSL